MNTQDPPVSGSKIPQLNVELIDRYAAGICTPEERLIVESVLTVSYGHTELLQAMRQVSVGGARVHRSASVERGWERFQRLVERPVRTTVSARSATGSTSATVGRGSWIRNTGRLALVTGAAVALLFTGFTIASRLPQTPSDQPLATYVTPPGERAKIELTDGTVISLNVASRVEIPSNFGNRNRTVRLWGEAHFNVVHNSGAPFTVSAGGIRATVLGTEFGVRAYRQDAMQVAVRRGKVSVNNAILGANDVAQTDLRGEVVVLRNQDVASMLGFATGRLVFSDIPLRDAVEDLNRWYDVEIRFADRALESQHIRATLAPGSAGDLMDILQLMFDVRVVRNGRILTLYSK